LYAEERISRDFSRVTVFFLSDLQNQRKNREVFNILCVTTSPLSHGCGWIKPLCGHHLIVLKHIARVESVFFKAVFFTGSRRFQSS
jgi:hypothetical protein